MKNKEMKAVHAADLPAMLRRHGQLEDFENGRIACAVCSGTIDMGNAGSLRIVGGRLAFACRNIVCYDELVRIAAR